MYACIHTCIHAYTHTRTHAYIHTWIHTYIHICIHAYIHTRIHKCRKGGRKTWQAAESTDTTPTFIGDPTRRWQQRVASPTKLDQKYHWLNTNKQKSVNTKSAAAGGTGRPRLLQSRPTTTYAQSIARGRCGARGRQAWHLQLSMALKTHSTALGMPSSCQAGLESAAGEASTFRRAALSALSGEHT